MNRAPGELKAMLERFEAVIRSAGVKLTPQRLEIYRETARTGDHPALETIYRSVRRKMPRVSLDTVYRTLDLFRELGLVSTLRPLAERVRFDANTSPHHHFVCMMCGTTLDFEHRDFDTLLIPDSASALGRVDSRHVELRGLCAPCSAGSSRRPDKNAYRTHGTRSHRHKTNKSRRD